jgi:hypothetical protein
VAVMMHHLGITLKELNIVLSLAIKLLDVISSYMIQQMVNVFGNRLQELIVLKVPTSVNGMTSILLVRWKTTLVVTRKMIVSNSLEKAFSVAQMMINLDTLQQLKVVLSCAVTRQAADSFFLISVMVSAERKLLNLRNALRVFSVAHITISMKSLEKMQLPLHPLFN